MRLKLFWMFLGAGFGFLNASAWAGAAAQMSISRSRDTIDPKNGTIPWRWIGALRKGSTTCPKIRQWEKPKPLLPTKGSGTPKWYSALTTTDRALISDLGLDRLCVYTTKARPIPRFVIPRGSALTEASPDRMAVSVSAAPPKTVKSILADEFLRQTGPVDLPLTGQPNVRLTFLDSEPDGPLSFTPHQGLQHGYTLGHLAHEIVCGGSACAATIQNVRALAYGDPTQDPLPSDQAGYVGALSELGPKILQAIGEWKSSGDKHLVLNLSIGWDGEIPFAGGTTDLKARRISELDISARSIYGALQIAACNNVLVIAAAGNRRGGSLHDSNWPILPAAWELHRPSRHSRFGPKLVYAVGGVDWQGLPLPNSRTKGLPRRVAYGDHATADVNGTPTAVYTGTSVSAAVVSSVAAVVWDLRPELRPAQVMWLIDHSGTLTPQKVRADFYAGRRAPRIQEISLCAAVKKAWGRRGGAYSAIGTAVSRCAPLDWQPPVFSGLFPNVRSLAAQFQKTSASASPPCDSRTLLYSTGGSVSPPFCPTDQLTSVLSQRWVLPQPGDNPCANCVLFPTGPPGGASSAAGSTSTSPGTELYDLAIEIDPSWNNGLPDAQLESTAMLEIDRFEKGRFVKRDTYPIHVDPTQGTLTVSGLGDGHSLKGCRAQLNWVVKTVTGPMSIQSPVVVDP
jgi:subtilase family protein